MAHLSRNHIQNIDNYRNSFENHHAFRLVFRYPNNSHGWGAAAEGEAH